MKKESTVDDSVRFGNELFSVSTEYSYLYEYAKLCIKYNLDLQAGVLTMNDCIEIMKLVGQETNTKLYKAKYWIANALCVTGYKKYFFDKTKK